MTHRLDQVKTREIRIREETLETVLPEIEASLVGEID
jgi:hypothetical protein